MTPHKLTLRELQDWMRETGRGYKAASAHFGVPETQLRAMKATAFRGGPGQAGAEPYQPARSDPGDASASADGATDEDEPGILIGAISAPNVGDLDPATATTKEFLEWRLRYEIGMVNAAVTAGSPNVARNWEIIAQRTRSALDAHVDDLRRQSEERGRGDITDPAAVAKRVLKRARELVNLAPAECEDLLRAWAPALRYRLERISEEDPREDPAGEAPQDPALRG